MRSERLKGLEKFLAIAFMCHRRPDRSFFINGKQMPLCARCTGILVGYFVGIFVACVMRCRGYGYFTLLLLPMIVDGTVQQFTAYESNNILRLITGILGGVGIIHLFIAYHMFTVWWVRALLSAIS